MTAIKLPGQLELPTVIDHTKNKSELDQQLIDAWSEKKRYLGWPVTEESTEMARKLLGADHPALAVAAEVIPREFKLAKLLRDYENRPTSETWSRIQALAAEILK